MFKFLIKTSKEKERNQHKINKNLIVYVCSKISSRPGVFSSGAPIPKTHFDIRLVRVSCYGYEI